MYIAGIDAGGSKSECVIYNTETDKIISRAVSGAGNYQSIGLNKACKEINTALEKAKKKANLNKVDLLGIGTAGAGRKEDKKRLRTILDKLLITDKYYLSDDGHIALLGATAGKKGVIVIAGTGSIAYALKDSGEKLRSGGWGPIIGDEGSGFWIGLKAIKKAIRASEKRDKSTLLIPLVKKEFSMKNLENLIPFVYDNKLPKKEIASLAPAVFSLAEKGDELAIEIVEKAADELVLLALSLQGKLDYNESKIAVSGGLFKNNYFYNLFSNRLKNYFLESYKPQFSAAYGAVFYALREAKGEFCD
ncbi:MAG: N-acetylglucosamine kinase [Bacillota bacterium]